MGFNINKFVDEFKNTIGWMLEDKKYKRKLRDELKLFKNNRKELSDSPDSIKALRLLIEIITYQAWYFKSPRKFLFKVDSRFEKELAAEVISKELMREFNSRNHVIHSVAKVDGIYGDWKIINVDDVYIIEQKNEELSVFYSEFHSKMNRFVNKHGTNIRTPIAKKELSNLIDTFAPSGIKVSAKGRIGALLEYSSIKQFTEELNELAKQEKTNKVLGEKGRDNYLRDFGYWKRVPMDRHEMRFIVRTGIYHACSIKNNADPLQKASLHDALFNFCSNYLKGYEIDEIDLGNAPGIVDIFIWSYCGKERYNICGSSPKCDICNLNSVCLYGLTKLP